MTGQYTLECYLSPFSVSLQQKRTIQGVCYWGDDALSLFCLKVLSLFSLYTKGMIRRVFTQNGLAFSVSSMWNLPPSVALIDLILKYCGKLGDEVL